MQNELTVQQAKLKDNNSKLQPLNQKIKKLREAYVSASNNLAEILGSKGYVYKEEINCSTLGITDIGDDDKKGIQTFQDKCIEAKKELDNATDDENVKIFSKNILDAESKIEKLKKDINSKTLEKNEKQKEINTVNSEINRLKAQK
jgi:predicted  nucleic acid-binding Zn-ribbon protein